MEDSVGPLLLAWYDEHARRLPWRLPPGAGMRADPYRVWLSEVMLQQTTVATVILRFERFLARWPDLAALAAAPPEAVMAEWAGLGYYSRARNLVACAGQVAALGGFPQEEAELRKLPGLGAYTAAAVAAIAFDRRAVVVDANVERVVARLFAIAEPLPGARKAIRAAAGRLTPACRPGDFAQGMMDLGATICTPRAPRCGACPLAGMCRAHAEGLEEELPVRPAKRVKPLRRGTAWWIEDGGKVLLVTRPAKGMLAGMRALPDDGWSAAADGSGEPPCQGAWREMGMVRHGFTHLALDLCVRALVGSAVGPLPQGEWIARADLPQAGLPTLYAKAARLALDQAAAKHQPHRGDAEHGDAQVAPGVLVRDHPRTRSPSPRSAAPASCRYQGRVSSRGSPAAAPRSRCRWRRRSASCFI